MSVGGGPLAWTHVEAPQKQSILAAQPAVLRRLESAQPAVLRRLESALPAVLRRLESALPAVLRRLESAQPAVDHTWRCGVADALQALRKGLRTSIRILTGSVEVGGLRLPE